MKTSLTLVAVLTLGTVAGTVFSGCASTATRQSTGEYVDDAATTAKVKTALIRDDTVKALQVDVGTFKGHVQLNGFVDTDEQRLRAEQIARSVEGVQQVTNNLALRTAAGESAGAFVDDTAITAKVKTAMFRDPTVRGLQVQVETHGGTVQLSGFVDNEQQRALAERIASSVEGVRGVQNQITVKTLAE
jgi:hyperosmotically inducible periplasmic protein